MTWLIPGTGEVSDTHAWPARMGISSAGFGVPRCRVKDDREVVLTANVGLTLPRSNWPNSKSVNTLVLTSKNCPAPQGAMDHSTRSLVSRKSSRLRTAATRTTSVPTGATRV